MRGPSTWTMGCSVMTPARWLLVLGTSALLTVALLVAVRFAGPPKASRAEAFAEQGPAQKLEAMWAAPDFAFVDDRNVTVTRQALVGKVWVANFVFTQCRTICPLLTSKMVQLMRRLPGVDARFVSFSVDPEHDTPAVLSAYRQRWAADEPRWTLLATTQATLPQLAAGFHVTATPGAAGDLDPIMHSGVFVLVDKQGVVRGVFDSEHAADFQALERGVRVLAGEPGRVVDEPTDAVSLYHALSCASCHENEALAPKLVGLVGSKRELDTGIRVTFDDAYVRESLLSPDAKRLRGYPLRMPSYDGLVSGAALDTLVSWLLRPGSAVDAGSSPVEVAEDPVCHMQVRVTADALKSERDGGAVYFCSSHCQRRFDDNPAAFGR